MNKLRTRRDRTRGKLFDIWTRALARRERPCLLTEREIIQILRTISPGILCLLNHKNTFTSTKSLQQYSSPLYSYNRESNVLCWESIPIAILRLYQRHVYVCRVKRLDAFTKFVLLLNLDCGMDTVIIIVFTCTIYSFREWVIAISWGSISCKQIICRY